MELSTFTRWYKLQIEDVQEFGIYVYLYSGVHNINFYIIQLLKVNVKVVPALNHHATETCGGVEL
jgi:hypothetical protein